MTELAILNEQGLEPLRPRRGRTGEEVQRGLIYLALAAGQVKVAERRLKEDGYDWPDASLLKAYKTERYPRRYAYLAAKYSQNVEDSLIIKTREVAHMAADLSARALARASESIDTATPTDAAKIAQQSSVAMGIHVDKGLVLDGRPDHITETRDAEQIVSSLARRLGLKDTPVDTTAQEITT